MQLSYIYLSCIPVFFQLQQWLVCLMPFAFEMPWRKKGEYSGKRKPQSACDSPPVCSPLATQGWPQGGKPQASAPLWGVLGLPSPRKQAAAGTAEPPLLFCGDLAPSECSAWGIGARGRTDTCTGKDAVRRHRGSLINYYYLTI